MMDAILNQVDCSDRIVVIGHTHADLDSVGSAVGLAHTFETTVDIALPGSIQSGASCLLEEVAVVSDPDLETYNLQVVVDAPSQARIAPIDPTANEVPLVVIDHHEPVDLRRHATAQMIDTDVPATALLVATLLEAGPWDLPPAAAEGLVAGALDDTDFRAVVRPGASKQTLNLLEQADDVDQLATLWDSDSSWSERMATAKAVVRAEGYRAGRTVMLISRVSSEETAAATALLDSNADIGIIVSEREDQTRVVARTTDAMIDHLSLPEDVLHPLVEEFGGDGGGHATAGVAKLETGRPAAVENRVRDQVDSALEVQFGRLS